MENGGFKFVFANEKIKEYECTLCSYLLMQAMELPCSHLHCQSCIWEWQQKSEARDVESEEEERYHCPSCREVYSIDQIHPNPVTDRIITNSLDVKCFWYTYGCPWNGTIVNFHDQHKAECNYSKMVCPFQGCGQIIHRSEIDDHEESCPHRYSECRVCNVHVDWKENKNHQCMIPCRNEGCPERIEKSKLMTHVRDECEYSIIECKYERYGCYKKLPRKQMEEHQRKCECLRSCYVKHENQDDRKREMKDEINKIKGTYPKLEAEYKTLNEKCEKLEQEWRNFEKSQNVVIFNGKKRLIAVSDIKMLIQENDSRTFMQYIITCPRICKMVDENGENLLHYAIRENRPTFALWLIEFDDHDDIRFIMARATTKEGLNAAQLAVKCNHKDVLKILLDKYTDAETRLANGSLLHLAVKHGSEECVEYLCSRVDIEINKKDGGKKADELEEVTKKMKKVIKHRRRCEP